MNMRFNDVLKIVKRVFSIFDFSGILFKNFIDEVIFQYFIFQFLVDCVLKDKEFCFFEECEVMVMFFYVSILFVLFV